MKKNMKALVIQKSLTQHSQTLNKYFAEVEKIPLISQDEEIRLATLYREKGDKSALDKLINANLRFVISVANKYCHKNDDLNDIIGYGNEGLIKAAQRFNPEIGVKFISYAIWYIRVSILENIFKGARQITLPPNANKDYVAIKRATEKLCSKLEREPTVEEICEHISINESRYYSAIEGSFIKPVYDYEYDQNPVDLLAGSEPAPDAELDNESLQIEIFDVMQCLDPRTRNIIKEYFGLDGVKKKTIKELAISNSLSRQRVNDIVIAGIKRIRMTSSKENLRKFLE